MYRNAKAEMVRQGITLEELAEKMGNTIGTWSQKLNGKAIVTLDEAKKFKAIVKSESHLEILFKTFEEDSE